MPFFKNLFRTALITAVLTALCVMGASAACEGVGTVNTEALRLREAPNAQSTILATAGKGDLVVVLADAGDGWCKVDYMSIEGYMLAEYLDVVPQADVDLGWGVVKNVSTSLNVRSGPGTGYDCIGSLYNRSTVAILGVDNGWYKIAYDEVEGYVTGEYLELCMDSTGTRCDDEASNALGQAIAEYALQYLGKPYVWGGNGPNSFDCSGLVKYVYAHFGYDINRTARTQLSNGTAVKSWSELQVGDLVFFKTLAGYTVSHVGIYIGNGQFVHASSGHAKVMISSLFSGYFAGTYVCARHIID